LLHGFCEAQPFERKGICPNESGDELQGARRAAEHPGAAQQYGYQQSDMIAIRWLHWLGTVIADDQ